MRVVVQHNFAVAELCGITKSKILCGLAELVPQDLASSGELARRWTWHRPSPRMLPHTMANFVMIPGIFWLSKQGENSVVAVLFISETAEKNQRKANKKFKVQKPMESFVYSCSEVKELKKVLESDPLADDSFTRLGYVLREGKAYGVSGYVVYFKADSERAKTFQDQLAAVHGCAPLSEGDKKKVVDAIEAEENAATAGFGSVFG